MIKGYVGRIFREVVQNKKVVDIDLLEKFHLNLEEKLHAFIVGKTGSGKSYTAGVYVEEIIKHSQNCGVIIIDLTSTFGQMIFKNNGPEVDAWNKKLKGIEIIPEGIECVILRPGENFWMKTSDLTPGTFRETFGLKRVEPQARLYRKAFKAMMQINPIFSLDELLNHIEQNYLKYRAKEPTCEALCAKIDAIDELEFISKDGMDLKELSVPGKVSVIDITLIEEDDIGKIIVSFLAEKILKYRKTSTSKLNDRRNGVKNKIPEYIPPTHFIVDEAHNFFPENKFLRKMVKEGRSVGAILTAISQSVDLSKDLYTNLGHLFVGRNIFQDEISAIKKMLPVEKDLKIFRQEVRSLQEGQFLYYNTNVTDEKKIYIRPRLTQHPASTKLVDEKSLLDMFDDEEEELNFENEELNDESEISLESTLVFDHPYQKLEKEYFPRIGMDKISGVYRIYSPRYKGKAKVIYCNQKSISEIHHSLLKFDTDKPNKEQAIEELQRHYPDIYDESYVYVARLQWIEKEAVKL